MSDPLYDLLAPRLAKPVPQSTSTSHDSTLHTKYLSRLLSLRLTDLTTTEPQSLQQSHHSNHVSLQALSSRSHKTTTASSTHLSTLQTSLPALSASTTQVRESIPSLDASAVSFASKYSRSRDRDRDRDGTDTATTAVTNHSLQARKDSMLLATQSDKLTDILDLPALLSTAIASAGSSAAGSANYTQALDLFAHIKRLSIVYPDSALVRSVQAEAQGCMKSMTANLLGSLRTQNLRLAAAIRTVGWLRRVVPEMGGLAWTGTGDVSRGSSDNTSGNAMPHLSSIASPISTDSQTSEGSFGALFLVARLHTFLSMTEALAPLRDLADQETERRLAASALPSAAVNAQTNTNTSNLATPAQPQTPRRSSTNQSTFHGTQTERYLKRYIEIFREQSFSTISMYRNIFPTTESTETGRGEKATHDGSDVDLLALPSVLQQFPLHLVEIFMEVLRTYLPNVTDVAARESLLMQVLYAANSLGRLGSDFSMMISLLDEDTRPGDHVLLEKDELREAEGKDDVDGNVSDTKSLPEPEWARIIKKHRIQAARLDALATGQTQAARRVGDISVR